MEDFNESDEEAKSFLIESDQEKALKQDIEGSTR